MTSPTEKAAPIPALLPCPFCGGRAETWVLEHPEIQGGEDGQYQGGCAVACAETPWCNTLEEVAECWNRRADREARPSLPDSRGEREPQTFNDIIAAHQSLYDEWLACALDDAADRARARQGGNNG